jgi:NAD(P)-dependent dehydrogenase (short-subunit alcohol dehydrogenase family)
MRGVQGENRETAVAERRLGVETVELDVRDESVEAGVKNVFAEAGKIDVLVNNAGIGSAVVRT